jgi:hypothetical protein
MKTQQTLQFLTAEDLWAFKTKANLTNFEIIAASNILAFEGTEEQIALAINNYNATILGTNKKSKTA